MHIGGVLHGMTMTGYCPKGGEANDTRDVYRPRGSMDT